MDDIPWYCWMIIAFVLAITFFIGLIYMIVEDRKK